MTFPPLSSGNRHNENTDSKEPIESTSTTSVDEKRRFARVRDNVFARKCCAFASWTPKRCRWDPKDPPKFSMSLNLLFAFVSLP
jgi:hypothetical protein